jgi:hypothetical protein
MQSQLWKVFFMKQKTFLLVAAALVSAVLAVPESALATGSMAECIAAGFPKSCCLEQQNKGAWGESGEAARTRKWNELATCKMRAEKPKRSR